MAHYVQFRNQMTNADDEDLMALAKDLFGTNSFIVGAGSYSVVENSPVGMSVLINDGVSYVYSSTLGFHMRTLLDTFAVTASKAVLTIDSNSSGSTRIDIICIRIDTAAISDANASNIASLIVVKGTPGAGTPATPANYYKLAEITVADGETTITTSEITDTRSEYKVVIDTATQNITNKTISSSRFNPRTTTEVSSATPTINTDNTDIHTITALATAITSMTTNLSGTPVNGQKLIIRIKDNGTARAITWGASFASRGATLPTTTVLSKYQYNGFIWNSTTSSWDCVVTSDEA